jgi:hypothetical protein
MRLLLAQIFFLFLSNVRANFDGRKGMMRLNGIGSSDTTFPMGMMRNMNMNNNGVKFPKSTRAPNMSGPKGAKGRFPSSAPQTQAQIVQVRSFYISYEAPNARRKPSVRENQKLLRVTADYYNKVLQQYFRSNPSVKFLSIVPTIHDQINTLQYRHCRWSFQHIRGI